MQFYITLAVDMNEKVFINYNFNASFNLKQPLKSTDDCAL